MRNSLLFSLLLLLALNACRRDEFIDDDPSVMLEFSADTVIFDTVFTTVGSATRTLKVYNRGSNAVEIARLSLGEGEQSSFRMNVDGDPGTVFEDVLIPGDDSIFIFLEVTVDPNDLNSPLIEEDSILFITNGNMQHVDLVAWGQDANFFFPTNEVNGLPDFTCLDGDCFNGGGPQEVTWTADKPYVIYGYLIVDSLDHLTIEAGANVHFHNGSGLWVIDEGRITVNGTAEQPVTFLHDRLEPLYDDLPGQWDLIRINENSLGQDNVFEHAIIKNSILGIQATPLVLGPDDVFKPTSSNRLILNECIIQNTSSFGLFARNYRIEARNCVFADAGQYTCAVTGGGEYRFDHCTFANYWAFSTRSTPGFFMTNVYEDEIGQFQARNIEAFDARNCIFYGNTFEEFLVDFDENQTQENILFSHCLVRIDEMDISDESIYQQMSSNVSGGPGFIAQNDLDFRLTANAFVRDLGADLSIQQDILGIFRDAQPDLGAYEYVE